MSIWPQCSAQSPSRTRTMSMASQVAVRPVAGLPMKEPVLVPVQVVRAHT